MEDIRPNSHRYKESLEASPKVKPKLQPIISQGKARTKKKNGLGKIAGSIISEDAQNVKSYILLDVLVPSIKKAISDIVVNGIDMLLYGESRHNKSSNAGRVSYRNYQDYGSDRSSSSRTRDSRDTRERGDTRVGRGSVSLFDNVIVDSRGEAEDILSRLGECLEQYNVVSVADLYDLANITTFPHTYHNYGWKSIASAKVVPVRDGYEIVMPPVESIK